MELRLHEALPFQPTLTIDQPDKDSSLDVISTLLSPFTRADALLPPSEYTSASSAKSCSMALTSPNWQAMTNRSASLSASSGAGSNRGLLCSKREFARQ